MYIRDLFLGQQIQLLVFLILSSCMQVSREIRPGCLPGSSKSAPLCVSGVTNCLAVVAGKDGEKGGRMRGRCGGYS